jgi:hypothetical protein
MLPDDEDLARFDIPPCSAQEWKAVEKLSYLPYFERVWIIQEVRFASSVVFFWGTQEIEWLTIEYGFLWLSSFASSEFPTHYALFSDHATSLEDWLIGSQDSISTGSRDKIFGLLGLIKEEEWNVPVQDRIRADYAKSDAMLHVSWQDISSEALKVLRLLSELKYLPDWILSKKYHLGLIILAPALPPGGIHSEFMDACAGT